MLDGPGILEIPFVKGESRATELGLLRFDEGRVKLGPDKLDRVRPLVNSCSDTFLILFAELTQTHFHLSVHFALYCLQCLLAKLYHAGAHGVGLDSQGASHTQTVQHTDLLSLHKVLGQLFEDLMVPLKFQIQKYSQKYHH